MIGMPWMVIELVALVIIFIGIFTDPWWRWTDEPLWWVIVVAGALAGVVQAFGEGNRLAALVMLLFTCGAGLFLCQAIIRRRKSGRTAERGEPWS